MAAMYGLQAPRTNMQRQGGMTLNDWVGRVALVAGVGGRLSDDERELVLAFRDPPGKHQRETLAAVMAKAEETRQVVVRALEKWGVKGFVPPEKAAKKRGNK